jgi:RNA 3'-terminal phosphate cyclase (ATP)
MSLQIDGSHGEGGGQILRTSLGLSLATGTPFEINHIRAGRRKPGLLRQHLTAVEAATRIGSAFTEGASIGSQELRFEPQAPQATQARFAVGTAGSATLVLQAILPGLLRASGPSHITLEGGTHNPFAPPYDFLARSFLPLLGRMGAKVTTHLERPGFYPAGGGRFAVEVEPCLQLQPLELLERGALRRRSARACVASIPGSVAQRELRVIRSKLGLARDEMRVEEVQGSRGPGNTCLIELEFEHVTEVFTGFGERDRRAEAVALHAVEGAQKYLKSGAPVGPYLADQLLVPLSLAGSGSFRCTGPSLHTRTNAEVIQQFLPVNISFQRQDSDGWLVTVKSE